MHHVASICPSVCLYQKLKLECNSHLENYSSQQFETWSQYTKWLHSKKIILTRRARSASTQLQIRLSIRKVMTNFKGTPLPHGTHSWVHPTCIASVSRHNSWFIQSTMPATLMASCWRHEHKETPSVSHDIMYLRLFFPHFVKGTDFCFSLIVSAFSQYFKVIFYFLSYIFLDLPFPWPKPNQLTWLHAWRFEADSFWNSIGSHQPLSSS